MGRDCKFSSKELGSISLSLLFLGKNTYNFEMRYLWRELKTWKLLYSANKFIGQRSKSMSGSTLSSHHDSCYFVILFWFQLGSDRFMWYLTWSNSIVLIGRPIFLVSLMMREGSWKPFQKCLNIFCNLPLKTLIQKHLIIVLVILRMKPMILAWKASSHSHPLRLAGISVADASRSWL